MIIEMNNKHIIHHLLSSALILLGAFAAAGCSYDDNQAFSVTAPRLVASTPADGTTDLGAGTLVVTLSYDQKIHADSAQLALVTAGDATIDSIKTRISSIIVYLSGLNLDKEYKVDVPAGVVEGASGVSADEASVSFSTIRLNNDGLKLCTPNASNEAVRLFNYLLDGRGLRTLSSTMACVNWNTNEAEWVYSHTGKYPAINCFDYIHFRESFVDYANTKVAEDWWNNGGIVAAMWHWQMPANGGGYSYTPGKGADQTSFDIRKIDDPNSEEYKQIVADLDKVAGYLKLLQQKHIPVIWRPLHEAAGNYYHTEWNGTAWFWWGYYGPEYFKKLWHLMYDRFVNVNGLDNLIWVWVYEGHDEWYPGDEYVDVVGCDDYNQKNPTSFANQYDAMIRYKNKLAALTECGSVAKISDQWKAGARWAWFMPWYDYDRTNNVSGAAFQSTDHQHANIDWWRDALQQDYVVTRDELPSFK